jgi:2-dehydropantoate 2-reductase
VKIAVFGAGGVGAFYGGLLARAGHDVHFVARGAQLDALRTQGLHIASLSLGEIRVPPVPATAHASEIGPVELVLLCVKAHQTTDVLDEVAHLVRGGTIVMALQNGVEADEALTARFGAEHVVSVVVYVGATLEAPGFVRHVAAGTLVISNNERIRDVLASTGLPVRISADIERQRWHKLAWNASFNAISALTLRSTQDLLANPLTRTLLVAMMREVVAVANAQGVALGESDVEQLVATTEKAAAIRTSMLVDRERGRPLETDALVGVVVRKGREAGIATPIAEVLYALLSAIDAPRAAAPELPPMEAGSFTPHS